MPAGSEFHTEGAAMLKPREAKVVWTLGTDNRLVLEQRLSVRYSSANKCYFSVKFLLFTFPSKFPTLKPTLLYSNTQSLVSFSVIPKCVTLNDL